MQRRAAQGSIAHDLDKGERLPRAYSALKDAHHQLSRVLHRL
jgi:hypothetical protein